MDAFAAPDSQLKIPTNGKWLLVNVDGMSYHRTMYDDRSWQLLIEKLISDEDAGVRTKAVLYGDVSRFLNLGDYRVARLLDWSLTLRGDRSLLAWENFRITYMDQWNRQFLDNIYYPIYQVR